MSNSIKVTLYAVLALLASVSGYYALANFGQMMSRAGNRNSELEQIEPERKAPAENPVDLSSTLTSAPPVSVGSLTNLTATNQTTVADTNNPSQTTNLVSAANGQVTNAAETASNTTVAAGSSEPPPTALSSSIRTEKTTRGGIGLWTALFVVSIIGLGLLIANDVSHYFGSRALKALYNDEGEGQKKPDYDKAEEVWANGDHLEAIRLMRDYLIKNPREQHVAIRIAEIYEKDLKNNLAAALEYEEVLKHKLASERWGWSAIHLCNLYFRLSQEQKAFELLRRVVNEHPNTAAAEKARKRLEQIDSTSMTEQIMAEQNAAPAPRKESSSERPSNLPPGFRPKK